MRSSEFTLEARRNPEQNPKESVMDVLDELTPKAEKLPGIDLPNLFVSFTNIPKLGINPSSRYYTPLGIYSYNADTVLRYVDLDSGDMSELPFAGNQPWANIFSVDGNIVDLQAIDKSQADQYYERLYSRLLHHTKLSEWRVTEIRNYIKTLSAAGRREARIGSPGGIFWYVTYKLSNSLRMMNIINSRKPSVIWNKIFRLMGITGFVDREGIIHENEPYQAVFFSMKSINLIRQMANKYSRSSISKEQEKGATAKGQVYTLNKLIKNVTTTDGVMQILNTVTGPENSVTPRSIGAILGKIPLPLRHEFIIKHPSTIKYFTRKLLQDIQAIVLSDNPEYIGEIDVHRIVDFDTMIKMLSDAYRTKVGLMITNTLAYKWRKTLVAVLSLYMNNTPPDKMYTAFMQYREIPPSVWAEAMLELSMPMKPDLEAQLEKIKSHWGYTGL